MSRVLIVDDEESIRVTLRAMAEKHGHSVAIAEDAAIALEHLEQEPFDVVVSDIVLPRKSGVALLAEIRELQPDAQVVMITGEPEVATAAEAVRNGAFDYLAKPVSRDDLEKVLTSAATKKRLLDHNRALEEENRRYREELEELVAIRTSELRVINQVALALGLAANVDEVYETTHSNVRSHMDAESFIISFLDSQDQLLRAGCAFLEGERFDVSKLPPIPLEEAGKGTQSQVVHTGQPLYMPDCQQIAAGIQYTVDEAGCVVEGAPPENPQDVIRSTVDVPLLIHGEVLGVMQVRSYLPDAYTESDISLLQGLAGVVAVAIENAKLVEAVRESLYGTVGVVGRAIELRDPYVAGHQQQVAWLAVEIGEEMGLSIHELEGLRIAGLLHDIGKISVPAEILSKPAPLNEMEFALMSEHPRTAYDLLKDISFPWPVADAVLQHHERLDGSGYPSGLKGGQITMEARIIAVADVVEAMASHRPYRAALGVDAALEEIRSKQGTHFDREVVAACLRRLESGESSFLEQIETSAG